MKLIIKKIDAKLDLQSIFAALYLNEEYSFWLDSSMQIENLSRYSFMGKSLLLHISTSSHKTKVKGILENYESNKCPFEIINEILNTYKISFDKDIPFFSGIVGYFGYEMHKYIEKIPVHKKKTFDVPESNWMLCREVLITDHLTGEHFLSFLILENEDEKEAEKLIDESIGRIKNTARLDSNFFNSKGNIKISSSISKDDYIEIIKNIKNFISQGQIYQACFTYGMEANINEDPFLIYLRMRKLNPAPFGSYIQMGDLKILSSSPERFAKLDDRGILESRPIKGTIKRGSNSEEDQILSNKLKSSIKDIAENIMIVDLVRNDLSKVCEVGSVTVIDLLKIEKYPTLFHLVSNIQGKLKPELSLIEAIKALFPGGSMTGAPKIRAMEILADLEPYTRNIYAGALGYIDLRGRFDLSMSIRSIYCKNKMAYFNVGGGIVLDSDAYKEYEESVLKSKSMKQALISDLVIG